MNEKNITINTQRNAKDVAMDLLYIYMRNNPTKLFDKENLINLYLEFYSTVRVAESIQFKDLVEYIPEELKTIVEQNY